MEKQRIVFINTHWLLITIVLVGIILLIGIPSFKLWSYNFAEAHNHVTNRGIINIESIQDKSDLEVLKVSDVEYITNEKTEDKVTSWLEVPGTGVFTVNLSMSEFIIDDVRHYILARVPKPEIKTENIEIESEKVKILAYQNNHWIFDNGSVDEGEQVAQRQLSEAQTKIQEDVQSNERYFEIAKSSAENIIKQLIKSLNEDVSNLDIEVEFF
ncbi:Protein of unknown function [Ruminococcaceae bacterium P7]|nr:Protein of unknown function [Ruminococcaceae bacterium P7]